MLLTVEEAAAVLGVGRSLMFELIAAGHISTVRVGRLRRAVPMTSRLRRLAQRLTELRHATGRLIVTSASAVALRMPSGPRPTVRTPA